MRSSITRSLVALCCLTAMGCYHARYVNVHGADHTPPAADDVRRAAPGSGWQNFFLYGWVPSDLRIDARGLCGEGRIQEIRTQQTFLQGLVAAVAGFYISIYTPYTGQTVCMRR